MLNNVPELNVLKYNPYFGSLRTKLKYSQLDPSLFILCYAIIVQIRNSPTQIEKKRASVINYGCLFRLRWVQGLAKAFPRGYPGLVTSVTPI